MIKIVLASEYYAKLEPIQTYKIKASVSGKIVFVNNNLESKNIIEEKIVQIDNKINKIDLEQSNLKLESLKKIYQIEKSTLDKFKKVSSKSVFDRDNQKIKILNIYLTISDLETKIATLKDTISKKMLKEYGRYIYDIAVDVGDYVNPGTLLYTTMNLTKGKLTIFIPIDDVNSIKNKTIYIDGKKTNLHIAKLYKISDAKHISSYRCEIHISNPKQFSKLMRIEFR
jgi:hypothetical protein